jgi:hypothetical protein
MSDQDHDDNDSDSSGVNCQLVNYFAIANWKFGLRNSRSRKSSV